MNKIKIFTFILLRNNTNLYIELLIEKYIFFNMREIKLIKLLWFNKIQCFFMKWVYMLLFKNKDR